MMSDFPPLAQEFEPIKEYRILKETYETFIGEDLIGSKDWSDFLLREDPQIPPEILDPNWEGLLLRLIKEGSTVIDYGARAGGRSLLFSQAVGIEGQVIAFEPNCEYFRALFWNLVHARIRQAKIYCPKEIEPIDTYKLENVSLIIIDAMGKEDMVLAKAVHTIHKNKPALILNILGGIPLERGDRFIHREFERRIAEIQKLGYTTQKINDRWYLALPR